MSSSVGLKPTIVIARIVGVAVTTVGRSPWQVHCKIDRQSLRTCGLERTSDAGQRRFEIIWASPRTGTLCRDTSFVSSS
jgi:hypothetical protein